MYFSAVSTLMSSSTVSSRRIIRKKPEVGLGVVGTNTDTIVSSSCPDDTPIFACIAAGIATLWGPAHGGANEAALVMLEDLLAQGGILNAFAGIPAGTFGDFDLQGIIERQIFMLGTSGSDVSDMRTVLRKIEDGVIDTTISLWAVTGMAGFGDAINSVINRTSGGKIMVFPSLHDLGLTPLSELAEKFPQVAAAMKDGLWTKESEEALLATR